MIRNSAQADHRRRLGLLGAIALVSVGLWQTHLGALALYPFTLLATWFHEMGHGLAALLTGSRFERLVIFADGSGYALYVSSADTWRLTHAFVAASGPLGPAIAGSLLIASSRTPSTTRKALTTLGAALLVTTLIWVRSPAGLIVLPLIGLAILLLARRGRPSHQAFGIQLLGVQACISVWRQFGYVFSAGGYVGGELKRSDTGAIADALLLPYWVWGAIISAAIVFMLWRSFRYAFRA